MGVLLSYFAAGSDQRAAGVIDLAGGPEGAGLPAVSGNGIDPVVQLGKLESLLTGTEYATVAVGPRSGHAVAIRDEGERLVLTVTDELRQALAAASTERLDEVAVPWSQTEEFGGMAEPEALAAFLRQLAGLASRAGQSGERLYCWVCV